MNDNKFPFADINLENRKYQVTIHVLVWAIAIGLPYVVNTYGLVTWASANSEENRAYFNLDLLSYLYWISIFYFNTRVLIPLLLFKAKYNYYALCLFGLFSLAIGYNLLLIKVLAFPYKFNLIEIIYCRLPIFVLAIVAGIALKMINEFRDHKNRVNETAKETLKTELSFLRSQISPHFIFNVLNNVVSLVRLNSKELEPTVIKLSGLMQYMLYYTEDDRVPIKTEQEYLHHYIDLQNQRFGKKLKVEVDFDVHDDNAAIEPLLLIPFVENAYKHGVGLIENPTISVRLKTDDKKNLYFTVINKFNNAENETKYSSSGIGVQNVSRRISLLYGAAQELKINKKDDFYIVELWLKLK